MTSNIGSQLIQQIAREGGTEKEMYETVNESLQGHFLPEFLNRIDESILFHPLKREEIAKIADLQIGLLAKQLEQQHLRLTVSETARRQIASQGYDPAFGARPLKRLIQQRLQNPLATELLKGNLQEGAELIVDYQHEMFTFSQDPAATIVETASVG
jgi:ATP-dependent Clp protease ATP-binding subunit ClpB